VASRNPAFHASDLHSRLLGMSTTNLLRNIPNISLYSTLLYSTLLYSTGSGRIMLLGSRARPVHRADNLIAMCEPIV
jgi:hypothetical protein